MEDKLEKFVESVINLYPYIKKCYIYHHKPEGFHHYLEVEANLYDIGGMYSVPDDPKLADQIKAKLRDLLISKNIHVYNTTREWLDSFEEDQ